MIHPMMATMLAVVLTDAAVAPETLWGLLRPAAARTWDQLSVDGDTSTNDTVFVLASGASGSAPVLAAALVSIGGIGEAAVGVPLNDPIVPLLGYVIVAYSLASYAPVRAASMGGGLMLAALVSQETFDAMRTPVIVDGRNLLDPAAARALGFVYDGIGRPVPDAVLAR